MCLDCHRTHRTLLAQAIDSAPAEHHSALRALCHLHGLAALEHSAAFYLSEGALPAGSLPQLRTAMLAACEPLVADGGRAVLALCEAFAIPDHCIQAPIAFDWRSI